MSMSATLIPTPFGEKYSINADYTASGAIYQPIEKFIRQHVHKFYNNAHSNAYNGKLMANYIEQSRNLIRKSIGAKPCDKIIFTGNGCSGAVTHLIHSLKLRFQTTPKTVVFVSVAEHHSNHLPWTHLPVDLEIIPLTPEGIINATYFEKKLKHYSSENRPMILSITAGSNVTGILQPVYALAKLAHKWKCLAFFDYAACGPYVPIVMHYDDETYLDAIFISPHKFLGGPGSPGILIASEKLFKNEEPFCPGGGTVRFVCKDFQHYSNSIEVRESGGTPNIIGCIKAGLAFQLKDDLLPTITKKEHQLNTYIRPILEQIENLELINPPTSSVEQIPIYSFRVKDLHYNFVVVLLNDLFGIQSRGGVSCCSVFAQYLLHIGKQKQQKIYHQIVDDHGVPETYGWCRITFHYTMTPIIVDYILEAITFVCKHGKEFLPEYEYLSKANNWIKRGFVNTFPKLDYHDSSIVPETKLTKTILDKQIADAYALF